VAVEPGLYSRRHLVCTIGIAASVVLTAFEAIAVNTAMPVTAKALHGLPLYSLAFSVYFATSLLGMVLAGERCDAHGPRLPYLAGVGSFAVGLLVSGTATTMAQFVAGRGIQGVGGGLVVVSIYVIIARAYPERLHPRAFSLLASCWVLPAIVGPAIAGYVATALSWRLVFLGIAALAVLPIVALYGTLRRIPRAEPIDGGGRSLGRAALAVTVGAGLIAYAADNLTWVGALLAVGGLALLAWGLPSLLPPGTLRARRGLPSVILLRGLVAGSYFGVEAYVPLMLVAARGLSPTTAGLALTGAAVSWAGASWVNSRSLLPFSRTRIMHLGMVIAAVALCGLVPAVLPAFPRATAAVAMFAAAFGMGLIYPNTGVLTLELSPEGTQGTNSASLQLSDSLGASLTIGLGGAVYHAYRTVAPHGVFIGVYSLMICVAFTGVLVAPRGRQE
jgi:MFS family permease